MISNTSEGKVAAKEMLAYAVGSFSCCLARRPVARTAYSFIFPTKASDMRQGSMQRPKDRMRESMDAWKRWKAKVL